MLKVQIKPSSKRSNLRRRLYEARYLYLLFLPVVAYYLIFHYYPMAGLIIAFKKYNAMLGFFGSKWIGLENYQYVFRDVKFLYALRNTFIISFSRILTQFPMPIVLAIMLSEVRNSKIARPLQIIYTFPNFLSWVIVGGIVVNFLGEYGAVNNFIAAINLDRVSILSSTQMFRPLLYITAIWKNTGWVAIIYLATITSIPTEQFEAAEIDGSSRLQRIWYITVPSLRSTIIVMLILNVGSIMDMGFDQVFNLQNPAVLGVSEIIGTYIYRITFTGPMDFGFSTAMGLFKSVINFIFLLTTDRVAKFFGESGLF